MILSYLRNKLANSVFMKLYFNINVFKCMKEISHIRPKYACIHTFAERTFENCNSERTRPKVSLVLKAQYWYKFHWMEQRSKNLSHVWQLHYSHIYIYIYMCVCVCIYIYIYSWSYTPEVALLKGTDDLHAWIFHLRSRSNRLAYEHDTPDHV